MMRLLTCLIILALKGAYGMECLEPNDSGIGRQMYWMCENANWWNDFDEWKRDVQSKCLIFDLKEYWKIDCPDFSTIRCTNSSSRLAIRNSFNCTVISCTDGRYTETDYANLLDIFRKSSKAYKKLISLYRNELRYCTRKCPESAIATEAPKATYTTLPTIIETSTRIISDQNTTKSRSTSAMSPTTTAAIIPTTSESEDSLVNTTAERSEFTTGSISTAARIYSTEESTVGPSCPDGWITRESSCYYFSHTTGSRHSWYNARSHCESMNSHLVVITNQAEQEFVQESVWHQSDHRESIWIGLNDLALANVWEWVDGTPLIHSAYSNWYSGEPNHGQGEDCVEIATGFNGGWNDVSCDPALAYVCERALNQVVEGKCPHGWTKTDDRCYYFSFHNRPQITWEGARSQCETMFATLVTIDNETEHDLVATLTRGNVWIGANDLRHAGVWEWVDGSPFAYTNWIPGQPDNHGGSEHCGEIRQDYGGLWNDHLCARMASYACEKGMVYDQAINDYIGSGWKMSGNFLYKAFSDLVDYATATSSCESMGGRLATEVLRHPDAIGNIIDSGLIGSTSAGEAPWIGYDDIQTEGSWVWVDGGVTNDYTTVWDQHQPDNNGNNENCGHMWGVSNGKVLLNDITCQHELFYICEINVDNL